MMELDDYISDLSSALDDNLADFEHRYAAVAESQFGMDEYIFCDQCGAKLPAGSRFCMECGAKLFNEDLVRKNEHAKGTRNAGVIITDTAVLADKYQDDQEKIKRIFQGFISVCTHFGVEWELLDMADRKADLHDGTWMDYSDVLQSFIDEKDIAEGPQMPLFIVGGNDVIPQPAEANPCGDPTDEYQEFVYADFYYCFNGPLPLNYLDINLARCNVARLPLEMGAMGTTVEDDIQGYFQSSVLMMQSQGISIGSAVMTSNIDWIPASREMSRNLPMPHMDDVRGETMDNMYLSPGVLDGKMDESLESRYLSSLEGADMLVFNLHGACDKKYSGFYSSDLAFSINMLKHSNAKVFNTVACWGARYIKYKRKDSMLLNAIYGGGVLLYSGSCVPALGKCGNYQMDDTWRIQPAAYSESFMARFAEYECLGTMSAGEAFLRAKCDYYNSSRAVEDDECTLGTVLMFNLYGCPALRTCPDMAALGHLQSRDGSKSSVSLSLPFRSMNRQIVLKSHDNEGKSLLDDIRAAVDFNLRAIHEDVTRDLYERLGLQPRDLACVERFSTTDAAGKPVRGYLYNYRQRHPAYSTDIRAKVDENGSLIDVIQTK